MSAHVVSDSLVMMRRDLKHLRRFPAMTIATVMTPAVVLLLFVYVLGGAMAAQLGGTGAYVNYVVPGIILMTVGSGCAATAVGISVDKTEGIIARFRTMAITRGSVLTGRVLGSMIRTMGSMVLVFGVALLCGFRPTAGVMEWLALAGFVTLMVLAMTWLAVAFGVAAKTPEGANGATLLLQFGPFISSAFVPPETMPPGVGWIAEHQPFTPMIDTVRGLLLGTPIGNSAVVGIAWAMGIAVVGYLWARRAYYRTPPVVG